MEEVIQPRYELYLLGETDFVVPEEVKLLSGLDKLRLIFKILETGHAKATAVAAKVIDEITGCLLVAEDLDTLPAPGRPVLSFLRKNIGACIGNKTKVKA